MDTGGFLASLEDMGFYVADQSHANYIQTVYSIPSALNFSYLEPKPAKMSGYSVLPGTDRQKPADRSAAPVRLPDSGVRDRLPLHQLPERRRLSPVR